MACLSCLCGSQAAFRFTLSRHIHYIMKHVFYRLLAAYAAAMESCLYKGAAAVSGLTVISSTTHEHVQQQR